MAISTTVLFARPQREVASLIRDRIARSRAVSIVSGFLTRDGLDRIADAITGDPAKLQALVVGAGTYPAFLGLDGLLAAGVAPDRLHVHLGWTRSRGQGKYARYRPMLHSKIYLMEMADGSAAALVGSHNMTGFALGGLNGEAGILLEGDAADGVFRDIRAHVAEAVGSASRYDPTVKEGYCAWTEDFLKGLEIEARAPKEFESRQTFIVLAESPEGKRPQPQDIVYFEIPNGFDRVESMRADVHLYLFKSLPPTPAAALARLDEAFASIRCAMEGMELAGGGLELKADWLVADRNRARLETAPRPFRPAPTSDLQQVRVRTEPAQVPRFEYLFDKAGAVWTPVLDRTRSVAEAPPDGPLDLSVGVKQLPARRSSEPWFAVTKLEREARGETRQFSLAMAESRPDSGSYILASPRRRRLGTERA